MATGGGRQRYTLKQRWADALAANPRVESTRPIGWGQAMAVMAGLLGVLWVVEIVNVLVDYRLDQYGLRPRSLVGLWGILTMPFLHASAYHLLANSGPFLVIGWVVMLGGWRSFSLVTAICAGVGGVLTWLVAPADTVIVGVSGLVFGWLGYIVARAVFSRRIAWMATAIVVLIIFGTMFLSVFPQQTGSGIGQVSWQAHLSFAVAGMIVGWLLHPHKSTNKSHRFARARPS